jgi:enamine deaminase RidA (YjgF/YER057c/UK114 family)
MRTPRNPESVHAPLGPYTHQIALDAPGQVLVLSGQVGMAPDGQIPETGAEQLEVALANVLRNLEAAEMSARDLVKLTIYVTEPIDREQRAAILMERLEGHRPCMTLITVAGLAAPPLKVEVDAWASST